MVSVHRDKFIFIFKCSNELRHVLIEILVYRDLISKLVIILFFMSISLILFSMSPEFFRYAEMKEPSSDNSNNLVSWWYNQY